MPGPEEPKPPNGWFIDRLRALYDEAVEMSESARKHKDVSGYATWSAIAAFLLLAISMYTST